MFFGISQNSENIEGYTEASAKVSKIFKTLERSNPFFFRSGKRALARVWNLVPSLVDEKLNLVPGQVVIISQANTKPFSGKYGFSEIHTGEILVHDSCVVRVQSQSLIERLSKIYDRNKTSIYQNFDRSKSLLLKIQEATSALAEYVRELGVKTTLINNITHAVTNRRMVKGDHLFLIFNKDVPGEYSYVSADHIQFLQISDSSAKRGGPFLVGVAFPGGNLVEIPLIEIKSIHKVTD